MGLKADELQTGCFARAEPDEPMFVLLARDRLAPFLVRAWASLRTLQIWIGLKPASDWIKVDEARDLVGRMTQWRKVDRFKSPLVRFARSVRAASETVDTLERLVSSRDLVGHSARTDALIPPGSTARPPLRLADVRDVSRDDADLRMFSKRFDEARRRGLIR